MQSANNQSQQFSQKQEVKSEGEDQREKRVQKEKRKCMQAIEKALSSIQFDYQMRKSDQNDELRTAVPEDYVYIDYDKEFALLISLYITKPFGKDPALNQDLHELYT